MRAFLGGEAVVDTVNALYVWEGPHYPQWYVPLVDVANGAFVPTGTEKRSPSRGTASHYTIKAGGKEAVDAAWRYADSPLEELRDRVRIDWSAMDAWFEEDEEVIIHPRDPAARIAILPSSRHVVVSVDGVVVADSTHPTFLHETGLPMRTYLPKVDVRMDLLTPTQTRTGCPYKGWADYWTLRLPDGSEQRRRRVGLPDAAARVAPRRGAGGVLRRPRRRHDRRRGAAPTGALTPRAAGRRETPAPERSVIRPCANVMWYATITSM